MGTQYRSGVYTLDDAQQAAAEAAIERLNDKLGVRPWFSTPGLVPRKLCG